MPRRQLKTMAAAGDDILECYRVLGKTGDNIVGEVLRGEGPFVEMDHYPSGDVYDGASGSQYYYHAHRDSEHGHFHIFVRQAGMPAGLRPAPQTTADYMETRDDTICHLVAIAMNSWGFPTSLFTTNRWVTAENWYGCEDVIRLLDRFEIDHARPSWPLNRWLSALVRLFQPQIVELLRERDRVLAEWRAAHPESDVFEAREIEVLSEQAISVEDQIRAVQAALARTP